MMASNERQAVDIILSGGNRHDAPQGRILMEVVGKLKSIVPLIMDKAYEDDLTRYQLQTNCTSQEKSKKSMAVR